MCLDLHLNLHLDLDLDLDLHLDLPTVLWFFLIKFLSSWS